MSKTSSKTSSNKSGKPRKSPGKGKKGRKGASPMRRRLQRLLGGLVLLGLFALVGVAVHYDSVVREKFSGKRWSIPAKVYARPLELYVGANLNLNDFVYELEALGYRREKRVQGPGDMVVDQGSVTLHTRGFKFIDGAESPRQLKVSFKGNEVSSLSTPGQGAQPLARLEPLLMGGLYPASNEDRLLVRLQDVPPLLPRTLVAVEDRDYYKHFGVSPKGIARAVWANLTAGGVVQGGSTLTQQLVKNFYLTSERSLSRKAKEALMSVLLELRYDKPEILEAYLNEVFLGQDGKRAIHGFGLASQYYFGQPLNELRLHQIALLVGMVKGPSYYNPRRHPERALQRRNLVLGMLASQKLISSAEATAAQKLPLSVTPRGKLAISSNPAFFDMVKRQLRQDYQESDLTAEGLQVFTSLDPILQRKAEQAVQSAFKRLSGRKGSDQLETAMVVANPQSAEVLAMIGSRDNTRGGFNRALDAVRPIGSLVKPAVYLTALEQPKQYSLTTIVPDERLSITTAGGKQWSPENYDHLTHGTLPLFQGLAHSYNLSTARLGLELGVPKVLKTVSRLGVDMNWPDYPAMLLGAGALTPLQVADMYQTIANDGFHSPLRAIRNLTDSQGQPVRGYPYQVQQRFDSGVIYLLQEAMHRVMTDGTARSTQSRLPGRWLAGKTGTTNDARDSWFAGFGENLMAVVWMGRDDNGKTPVTGASGALQVWSDFMIKALPQSIDRTPPANVVFSWVDLLYGAGTTPDCPGALKMPYIRGTEPPMGPSCDTGQFAPYNQVVPQQPRPQQPAARPQAPARQAPSLLPGWLRDLLE